MLTLVNSDIAVFFAISGYLFEKNFDKYQSHKLEFVKKKAYQLLFPYLFWSLILYVGAWVFHSFVGRRLNKLWAAIAILLIASGLNYYFELPYLVWKFLQHYSDFLIGRIAYGLIREDKVNSEKRGVSVSILLLTSIVVTALNLRTTNGLIYVWAITMAKHIMCWSMCFCCFWFASMIKDHKFGMILSRVGDYSYDIYLMHTPYVVPVVAKAMYSLTGQRILSMVVTTLCGVVIPVIISSFLLRKTSIFIRLALGKL